MSGNQKTSRRKFIAGTVSAAIAAGAVGAGAGFSLAPTTGVETTVTKTLEKTVTGTAASRAEKTVKFAWTFGATHTDPHRVHMDEPARLVNQAYDPVVTIDRNGRLTGWLANKWESSPDAKTHTFYLVRGVKFHDGTMLDAELMKWNFERALTIKALVVQPYMRILPLDNLEVVDKYTFRVNLTESFAPFPSALMRFWVASKKTVEANIVTPGVFGEKGDWGSDWLNLHDAGSGPYVMAERKPNEFVRFVRFPDYWRGWKPDYFDEGTYTVMAEAATIKAAITAREIDWTCQYLGEDIYNDLMKVPGITVNSNSDIIGKLSVTMNHQKEFTKNIHVRKALVAAFDYEKNLKDIWGGIHRQGQGPMHSAVPYFDPTVPLQKFDLEEAKKEVELSGFDPGEITLQYVCVPVESRRLMGMLLAENAEKIGIHIEINVVPFSPNIVEMLKTSETTPDLLGGIRGIYYMDPDACLHLWYHSSRWKDIGPSYHTTTLMDNPEVDRLLDEGRRTVPEAERAEIYKKAQHLIYEDAADIWAIEPLDREAVLSNLEGIEWNYCSPTQMPRRLHPVFRLPQ